MSPASACFSSAWRETRRQAFSYSFYNPFQYASGWVSGVTSFSHFGARWYAPQINFTRWTQQDPVAGSLFQPTSQCRYAYADDNPVNVTDASGKDLVNCEAQLFFGAALIVIGAAAIAGAIASGAAEAVVVFAIIGGGTSIISGWVTAGLAFYNHLC